MPQEFHVLQCYSCNVFQVDIIKKVPKWSCKMCGEKQSVKKVYSKGSGKDCRLQVQELNEKRIRLEAEMHEYVPEVIKQEESAAYINNGENSKWFEFINNEENSEENISMIESSHTSTSASSGMTKSKWDYYTSENDLITKQDSEKGFHIRDINKTENEILINDQLSIRRKQSKNKVEDSDVNYLTCKKFKSISNLQNTEDTSTGCQFKSIFGSLNDCNIDSLLEL